MTESYMDDRQRRAASDDEVLSAMLRDHASVDVELRGATVTARPRMTGRIDALARDIGEVPPLKPDATGPEKRLHKEDADARRRAYTYGQIFDACALPNEIGERYEPGAYDRRWIGRWVDFCLRRLSDTEINLLFEAVERAGVEAADDATRIAGAGGGAGGGGGKADG